MVVRFTPGTSLYHWLNVAALVIAPRPLGPTNTGLPAAASVDCTSPVTTPEIPSAKSGWAKLKSRITALRVTLVGPVVFPPEPRLNVVSGVLTITGGLFAGSGS